MEKKLTSVETRRLIEAVFVLLIGILFCFSLVSEVFSIIIGVGLMIGGILFMVSSFLGEKRLLTSEGIVGVALIAFGVMFAVDNLLGVIEGFIPWLIIIFGAMIVLDSVLRTFVSKELSIPKFVIELLIGLAALALGICLKTIPSFAAFTSIMLGIVLIVYALYSMFSILFKKKKE